MTNYSLKLLFLLTAILLARAVAALEAPEAAASCQSCHQLESAASNQKQDIQNRAAPPLYFAGNKFRRSWLIQWLQSPTRIRPAGGFYSNHIKNIDGEDLIDYAALPIHASVDAEQAEVLADWLMSFMPKTELIAAEADYTPGNVSPRLGAMDFVKFKGCGGCHRDTPEYGGLSGPELYTAWQRLQPGYIVSYMRDPAAWDSLSTMPNRAMGDTQIHKLADYLKLLSGED